MKRFFVVLPVVAAMFLVACASHADKTAGGADGPARVSASGYTKEGCLLNLKITARERHVRVVPDEFQMETNWFIFLFPFLNQEGYRCSANAIERENRPWNKDPLYPFD